MGCKPLDDIVHSGHRNIKIPVNGLVALSLSMFFHKFFSQSHRQLFTLLSFLHAQCDTTQTLSQLFSIWTMVASVITILPTPVTCHRCLITNYRSITCLKSNYFLRFWQGANNCVQSIFEFCVKFYQVWLFFCFFVLFQCNKQTREYQNICNCSNFSNNFRDNGCIFWQNCKGANIFGYFCNFDVCTMCVFDAIDSYENVLFCSVVRLV